MNLVNNLAGHIASNVVVGTGCVAKTKTGFAGGPGGAI